MQGLQPMHSAAAASCNLFATMISSKWRAWRMATSRYPVLGPCVLFNDHTSTVSLMLRIGTHRATMRGTRARWQIYICHLVPIVPLIPTFVLVARIKGWVSKLLSTIFPICLAGVVGGRLWLTGFPLCFCEKYGNLARTDLKNEQISQSRRFQACSEIIRGVVGWSESRPEFQYK